MNTLTFSFVGQYAAAGRAPLPLPLLCFVQMSSFDTFFSLFSLSLHQIFGAVRFPFTPVCYYFVPSGLHFQKPVSMYTRYLFL